jgi:hypothetical protein
VRLTVRTFFSVPATREGILPEPKYEEAQQVKIPDSVCVSIEDFKKEAFEAQIINDCYGLGVAEKMIPEETTE